MTMELWPAKGNRQWRLVTDNVMGGISRGTLTEELIGDRPAVRMRGIVSTKNSGGFIQIAMDLDHDDGFIDAGPYQGICIDVSGNSEAYGVHLRTTAMTRPQQSYRRGFVASAQWQTARLPFAQLRRSASMRRSILRGFAASGWSRSGAHSPAIWRLRGWHFIDLIWVTIGRSDTTASGDCHVCSATH